MNPSIKIDPELIRLLACPACKQSIWLEGNEISCRNASCGLRFPIRDGIPVMLIEEAKRPV